MESLFYFTKANLQLDDIAKIAASEGYPSAVREIARFRDLYVYLTPEATFNNVRRWEWSQFEASRADEFGIMFDEGGLQRLENYSPASSFAVEYPPSTLPKLSVFLQAVLEHYGGWIGMDDAMIVVYDVDTIRSLVHYWQGQFVADVKEMETLQRLENEKYHSIIFHGETIVDKDSFFQQAARDIPQPSGLMARGSWDALLDNLRSTYDCYEQSRAFTPFLGRRSCRFSAMI